MTMLSEIESLDPSSSIHGEFESETNRTARSPGGVVSFAFLREAIRRGAWFCCAVALAGLAVGVAADVLRPPAYHAATTLFLTYGPYEDSTNGVYDNLAVAQSRSVAGLAAQRLGVAQPADQFLRSYRVAAISKRVLQITTSAPSSAGAVSRANAVAAAFLAFRAEQLQAQQSLEASSLSQQIDDARQTVATLGTQISDLMTRPETSANRKQIVKLQAQRQQASTEVDTLEKATGSGGTTTKMAVKGSNVLDAAAPIPPSRLRRLLLYVAAGLILGAVAGAAVVVLRALMSDRPRRRNEIAHALGAPVKLSVPGGSRGRHAGGSVTGRSRDRDTRLVVAQLRDAATSRAGRPAALAVVAIGDPVAAARAAVSAAVSYAREGREVVLADLCPGTPVAKLLGVKTSGVHSVTIEAAQVVVAVPDENDVAPVGPLQRPWSQARRSSFAEDAQAACSSADLVLTVATIDPAVGAENLATWATDAVAVVAAGKASTTRVNAIGHLVRLAGIHLMSAVLVGADKKDESLGELIDPRTAIVPDFPD